MTPDPALIRELFEFMEWADNLMLEAARTVEDEAYYAERGFSLGSIHKLMVHGMAAQKVWLERWKGVPSPRIETDVDHTTREELEARWPPIHDELFAFLEAQTPSTLAANVAGTNTFGERFSRPLAELMIHVVDHASYHRGQINSMIKLAGGETARPYYSRYAPGGPG